MNFLYPEFEVVRNETKCIHCKICEQQCANGVHCWDEKLGAFRVNEEKCVNCHRCVSLCPTRALKIVKSDHTFRENGNWTGKAIQEVYRQAASGGVPHKGVENRKNRPYI